MLVLLGVVAMLDSVSPPPKAEPVAATQRLELERRDGGFALTQCEGASLTAGGALAVWGVGAPYTQKVLARVTLPTGEPTVLFTGSERLEVVPTAEGTGAWFFDAWPPDNVRFVELESGRVTEAKGFGPEYLQVAAAMKKMSYFKVRALSDDQLLMEWKLYEQIPILFGRSREAWGLPPRDDNGRGEIYSRAILSPAGAPRFEVSLTPVLHAGRGASVALTPNDRIEGDARLQLPDGGVIGAALGTSYSGDLSQLLVPGTDLRIQPFELRRHPKTFEACGAGSEVVGRSGGYVMASNISNEHCTRISGVHLERASDGRLLRSLTHDLNMPSAKTLKGSLLVLSGLADTFAPSALSAWDVSTGSLLGRFALPKDAERMRIVSVQVSADGSTLSAVTEMHPLVLRWVLPKSMQAVAKKVPGPRSP